MAMQWGIGDITEEDVDDIFRATGADPASQPFISLSNYRELLQLEYVGLLFYSLSLIVFSLSELPGVRVKLVDQLAEQHNVIIGQELYRETARPKTGYIYNNNSLFLSF